jgi:hypothetical protein
MLGHISRYTNPADVLRFRAEKPFSLEAVCVVSCIGRFNYQGEVKIGSDSENLTVSISVPLDPRKQGQNRPYAPQKVAYSMTSAARATSVGGKSRPSALAVMRQDARIRELEGRAGAGARAIGRGAVRRAPAPGRSHDRRRRRSRRADGSAAEGARGQAPHRIKEWLATVRRTLEASDVRRAARASGRASYRTRGRHRMRAFLTPWALNIRVKAPVASKRGNRFPN